MRFLNRPLGRLSRYRRGPVAGLLVVLLGLLLTGGLYAAFSPASAHDDDSAAQIEKGRKLFLVGCSFCHGDNGQGVKTLDGNQLGPPLVGVGAAAVDFQVGTGKRDLTVRHLEQQVGQYRQRLAPFDHTHYLLQRLEQSFTLDAELHGGLPFTCCSFF